MQQTERKTLVHNLIFNLLDGGFFGFGLGFASFTTVLPLFVSMMTNSALLIGLIPAIHNVGWQFPQLLTAKSVSKMERFFNIFLFMTLKERVQFLGLAIIALLLPKIGEHGWIFFALWYGRVSSQVDCERLANMIVNHSADSCTFSGFQFSSELLAALGLF
jgi:hypothetical protein